MVLNKRVVVFCSIFLVGTAWVNADAILGDVCRIESKNVQGECVLLKNCPQALKDLKQSVIPQVCSFKGPEPVVCCAKTAKRVPGEISKQKCAEYGESVYVKAIPLTLANDGNNEPIKVDTCASHANTLIIDGIEATVRQFPHMALIGFDVDGKREWQCSGSLISDQYVLTAAHCILSRDFGPAQWVRLGETSVNSDTDDAEPKDFSISERIVHPEYKAPILYNDIALIKLNESVKFNRYMRPACLHSAAEINETRFFATGWNREFNHGNRNTLQRIVLDKVSQEQCNDYYKQKAGQRLIVPQKQLCAGGNQGKEECQGDSGGPIQVYNRDVHCMYDIVGVTSFGAACGFNTVPGVFTRVSAYVDWIEKIVWP